MRIETDHSEVQMAEMDTKDGMDQGGDHAARADIEDHVINRAAVVVTQDRADDRNIDAKATGVDPNSKYKKQITDDVITPIDDVMVYFCSNFN